MTRALRIAAIGCVLLAGHARAQDRDGAADLPSSVLAGTLVRARVERGAQVEVDGRAIRTSARGEIVLGVEADRRRPARVVVRARGGRRVERTIAIRPRRDPVEEISGVPRALVHLEGALRRAQDAIEDRLRAVRARDGAGAGFAGSFAIPAEGRISSRYGVHRVFDATARERHWGVDVVAPEGAPVRAPAGGAVVLDARSPVYGRIVVIDHGHGLTSSLLHLSAVEVEVGARVSRGDLVARVGRTGRVTGAHLDWRLHLLGVPLDPLSALDGAPR